MGGSRDLKRSRSHMKRARIIIIMMEPKGAATGRGKGSLSPHVGNVDVDDGRSRRPPARSSCRSPYPEEYGPRPPSPREPGFLPRFLPLRGRELCLATVGPTLAGQQDGPDSEHQQRHRGRNPGQRCYSHTVNMLSCNVPAFWLSLWGDLHKEKYRK